MKHKLFSEYLLENTYKTKEELSNAINSFGDVHPSRKQSTANSILRSAEKLRYTVKSPEVLKYDRKAENIQNIRKNMSTKLNTNIDNIEHSMTYDKKTHSFKITSDNYISKSELDKAFKPDYTIESYIVQRLKGKYITSLSIKQNK